MLGLVVVGALAPCPLEPEIERGGAASRQPKLPAEAVLALALREAEADLGRRREATAQRREAVAEPRLKAPPRKLLAVLVGGEPRHRRATQQGVHAARRRGPYRTVAG